ncbi:hypothetical protein [Rathayibacter toxicus]|uniref:hypothetical protein n=1 Tax=Rathayibacter toxicus TaxID=145458 RepID=UPI001C03B063|nr:hypothetical protein [Rathayibacter toxicus]QWL32746.1 hypothetical protein E2R35_07910 [Rathayibacter toxicus]QWL34841.1 hypothetical protein E2R36_07915 [Rathayibacter toxicus]QWL36972.1 hypothetical protein E2R37_07910 [Rathayibacter toxicus]QWL39064.1 hypothetical protein E2R38_07905 [Rathayibacter toxicus]QWL41150.1 hypothetical protein E2R39_07910 [Rathayibacter toxicus]
MTSEHNKEKAISLGNDWTIDMKTERGIERRTIVQGATWTIPAAALAVATPAFAASPAPTLAFTQSSYSGTACGTITGVQVKRTVDGTAPDPGKTVSVTLADGYTFADGTTTYSGTTDANGLITLPDIKVPAKGGNSNFSASSDSLAATAPVSATAAAGTAQTFGEGYTKEAFTKVPTGSTAVGFRTYLSSSGDLYYKDTLIASGVKNAVAELDANNATRVTYVASDGTASVWNESADPAETYKSVPKNSTAVGFRTYLSSSGDLYYKDTLIASGVKNAVAELDANNATRVTYVASDGTASVWNEQTNQPAETYTSVPKNSTAVGFRTYLSSSGDLYYKDTLIASGVKNAVAELDANNATRVTYVASDGTASVWNEQTNQPAETYKSVPKNSTAVGFRTYLSSSGDLYYKDTLNASGVTSAVAELDNNNALRATYVAPKC